MSEEKENLLPAGRREMLVMGFMMYWVWAHWVWKSFFEDQAAQRLYTIIPGSIGAGLFAVTIIAVLITKKRNKITLISWYASLSIQIVALCIFIYLKVFVLNDQS